MKVLGGPTAALTLVDNYERLHRRSAMEMENDQLLTRVAELEKQVARLRKDEPEHNLEHMELSPYDLSQVKGPHGREREPDSTRPHSDDPYSASTFIDEENPRNES